MLLFNNILIIMEFSKSVFSDLFKRKTEKLCTKTLKFVWRCIWKERNHHNFQWANGRLREVLELAYVYLCVSLEVIRNYSVPLQSILTGVVFLSYLDRLSGWF